MAMPLLPSSASPSLPSQQRNLLATKIGESHANFTVCNLVRAAQCTFTSHYADVRTLLQASTATNATRGGPESIRSAVGQARGCVGVWEAAACTAVMFAQQVRC
jgi:hypothetical protein